MEYFEYSLKAGTGHAAPSMPEKITIRYEYATNSF